MKAGQIEYEENECIRTEPLNGWHFANAQEHRTREDWTKRIKRLLDEQYPDATKIVLVWIN